MIFPDKCKPLILILLSHEHTLSVLWNDGARQAGQRLSLRNDLLSQAWESDMLYCPQAINAHKSGSRYLVVKHNLK